MTGRKEASCFVLPHFWLFLLYFDGSAILLVEEEEEEKEEALFTVHDTYHTTFLSVTINVLDHLSY